MRTRKKEGTLATTVPAQLAALIKEHAGKGIEDWKPLDPLPSVAVARAYRRREGTVHDPNPAIAYETRIALDVEVARDSTDEAERGAAIRGVAEWLERHWRVPARLKPVLARLAREWGTLDSKPGRRVPGLPLWEETPAPPSRDKPITYRTIKRGVLAEAAYLAMAEDELPVPVSRRRMTRKGHSFMPLTIVYSKEGAKELPLLEGLYAPGAFGWWDLYREWLIKRARFHAERRLKAILFEDVGDPRVEPLGRREPRDRSLAARPDRLVRAERAARAEEARLARHVAALPEDVRQLVRALDPERQRLAMRALPHLTGGRQKQAKVFLAWVGTWDGNRFDRARAFEAAGVSRSAGDKILNRALQRLREYAVTL